MAAGIFQFLYGFVVLLFMFSHRSTYYLKITGTNGSSAYFLGLLQISAGLFISLCGYAYWKTEK
jgi:hypothetical protein